MTSCDFMADSYLNFAADYDWLFDNDVLTEGGAIDQYRRGAPVPADQPD